MKPSCWWQVVCLGLLCVGVAEAQLDPADEVFYHFMPIAWRDSDNDAYRFGDFGGMADSLDYLEDLGITAVWMNPIFPSPAYHGYQHGRADELNAWFGSEADFLSFVSQAHARGIKVFVDMVCYGVSHDSIWFQDAYGNPSSVYDDWLAFYNTANTDYQGYTYTTWNGDTVGFIHWNLDNANSTALVTAWAQKWLDPNNDGDTSDGIDGYRLDHVWVEYSDGPNGWGYNLDDFWVPWKAALQTVNPDVFIFAEQADWGATGAALLPTFDAAFTKPFEFAARDALAYGSAGGLYSVLDTMLAELPEEGGTYMAIIGDHDVDRLMSVIGNDFGAARSAAAVLMTQPFPPIIYYGDELGMLGVKASYGTDANDIPMREPFKWNAVVGPPMSNYWVLNSQAYGNAWSQDNDGRSVEEQLNVTGSLLEEYRLLIATRKAHVALRRGSYHAIDAVSGAVWAFLRHVADDETLLVAINVSDDAVSTSLDLSTATIAGGITSVTDVIAGTTLTDLTNANKHAYPLTLGANEYLILAMDVVPGAPAESVIDGAAIPADLGAGFLVATQDNATGLGDNVSELDQFYVRPTTEGLHIGITGNLATDSTGFCLFFDTIEGGQNELLIHGYSAPPSVPSRLSGTVFDAGFAPDFLMYINAVDSTYWIDWFELPGDGSITPKTYRGSNTVSDGDGLLSGGTNPNGLEVAFDNTNTAGVTDTDASGAATATTGFEMFVPYGDVDLPTDPDVEVGLVVLIAETDGSVSNQWLPGLGGGYDNLGVDPDMTTIPGDQFVRVPTRRYGDMNCDGVVNFDDIDAFVIALVDQSTYAAAWPDCNWLHADLDGSGDVNFDDIDGFVAALVGK